MDDKERTPEEWDDAFEAIIDSPKQHPIEFYEAEIAAAVEVARGDYPQWRAA